MTYRGAAAFLAASRITVLIWGPSFKLIRLLYTAVVRPIMLYSSQIWGLGLSSKVLPKSALIPLAKLQNKCLYRTTGAYRRTPRAILEREAAVLPLDIYINITAI